MGPCFSQTRGSGASQPESKGGGGGRLGSAARASSRADTARAADTCPACPGAGLLAAVSGSAVLRGLLRGPRGACFRGWRLSFMEKEGRSGTGSSPVGAFPSALTERCSCSVSRIPNLPPLPLLSPDELCSGAPGAARYLSSANRLSGRRGP